MRAASTHRHAKTLGTAYGDIGTESTHRLKQHLRQWINGHRDQSAMLMGPGHTGTGVPEPATASRQLQQHSEHIVTPGELIRLSHLELNPDWLGPGAQNCQGLWQHGGIHQKTAGFSSLANAKAHRHCLCCRSGLIQKRGIGNRQAGQLTDQGLKIEQCLQASLSNFGLIRGVSRVPGGVFQHLPLDQRGRDRAVVAQADQRPRHAVETGKLTQFRERLGFSNSVRKLPLGRTGIENVLRDDGLQKALKITEAEPIEHQLIGCGSRADMALGERRKSLC